MCGSNCAAPVERSHEERVTFWWRRFLLLTYLVVTASRAQFCLMTQDEIRGRKLQEAQETRNRLRSTNQEQQVAGSRGKYRNQKPSPTVIPATIDRDLDPSKRPPTGGWVMRISDCPHPIEQRAFRENAYLEWMTCLSCGARWSRKTGWDDIQVKMGLITAQPQSTLPLSRMCLDDATTTDDKHNGDVLRMQPVSPVQKSGIYDYATCNLSSLPNFELWSIVWTTLTMFSGIPTTTFGASIVMCHLFLVGLGTCP